MIKKLMILIVVVMVVFTPFMAEAANFCTKESITPGPDKLSALPQCINQIYVWSLGIGSLLALLMIVLGGYMYMTASGNAEQTSKGKEYIWGAIIGLALLFTAYLLLRTINPDLTNFNNDSFNRLENPSGPRGSTPCEPTC